MNSTKPASILWLLLSLTLPGLVQAQFTYSNNNGALTITGYTGPGGNVTIPPFINGQPVTSIAESAFAGHSTLTNLVVCSGVTNLGTMVFYKSTHLKGIYFLGNRPTVGDFPFLGAPATSYYLPGKTNWTSYLGVAPYGSPAALWNPTARADTQFGIKTNQYGFNITGTTNIPVVVEASTNLGVGNWVTLQSVNLTNGLFYFRDPQWTNYPYRFYRLRSP